MDHTGSKARWDVIIEPSRAWWRIDARELWHYRDLLLLMVRRDLLSVYKQTILGPLWQVLQPVLTSLMFAITFGLIARLSLPGIPRILFYMAAVIPWTLFSNIVLRTSQTLIWNASLMSRVYFPRLLAPIATSLGTMVSFLIQLAAFVVIALGYRWSGSYKWVPDGSILLLPLVLALMTLLAFGLGILVAALTTKFRDLTFLLTFGIQLLMFMSPVIFPLGILEKGTLLHTVIRSNPMTPVLEAFRAMLLGTGMDWGGLLYTTCFTVVTLIIGLVVFQRVQRSFADVI